MDSSTHQNYQHQHRQNHPRSFLTNFTETVIGGSGLSKCNPCEGSESQNLISRFATCSDNIDSGSSSFHEFEAKPSLATFVEVPLKLVNPPLGLSELPHHYPRHNPAGDSSYGMVTSLGRDHHTEAKSLSSQLIRQSCSPAGPFTNIPFQNGFNKMTGFGICSGARGNIGEVSPSINELKSRTGCSSRMLAFLGALSQISEITSESIHGTSSPEINENRGTQFYGDVYGAWNDSSNFSDNFAGLKRQRSVEQKTFSSTQAIERRRGRLGDVDSRQFHTFLSLNQTRQNRSIPISGVQLKHNLIESTPIAVFKSKPVSPDVDELSSILLGVANESGKDPEFLTPQKKLLSCIDTVEEVVKEELQKIKRTPNAKRAERERKVRTLMMMI